MNIRFPAGAVSLGRSLRSVLCVGVVLLLAAPRVGAESSALPPVKPSPEEAHSLNSTGPSAPSEPVIPLTANDPEAPQVTPATNTLPALNASLSGISDLTLLTNGLPVDMLSDQDLLALLMERLETARYFRTTRQWREAEPVLVELLAEASPEIIRQAALLELAAIAQDENELTRAQQIYAQFLGKWAGDPRVPEILLRQGILFRRMGLNNLAFAKFYAVMTSALVLKNDKLDYYARLVLQAQMEIAETHYELGKYADAADFFSRLFKQNNPGINKSRILYKLVRCNSALGKNAEAVSGAQEFLMRYAESPEQPEVRFYLALALKDLGRNNESLQQVLLLLQEQRARTKNHPEIWAYWQQRTGNIIANQLFREGDYAKALEVYQNLANLDRSLSWQLSVQYQIGMTYERLWQSQKANDIYTGILAREKELGDDPASSLKTVIEMARWRISFLQWQNQAEAENRLLRKPTPPATASLPTPRPTIP